ncbi:MAG: GH36 C-terminal domain-containing protein, partial [Enterococcus sp.]
PNTVPKRLRLKSLEATARYLVNKEMHSGQELMKIGLMIDRPVNDFYATKWKIEKMEDSDHVDIEIG